MIYLKTNVFEEAVKRVNMIFDHCDDVIVAMSGGKDSTVVFHLALEVAKEQGRLPLKVFWLDQEAEWQHTVDYMRGIMHSPLVKPYWFQIPFDFTNSLSNQENFLRIWDEAKQDLWIHPKDEVSIKENPTKYNRFHKLINELPKYCTDSDKMALLSGMRIEESVNRRLAISGSSATFFGETWANKPDGCKQIFYPIYDFTHADVWTAIAKNHWEYNKVYDLMYQYGLPKQRLRVSALIHETSWRSMELLQETEPQTYNRFTKRVNGTSAMTHAFSEAEVVPTTLPFAFSSWKEYRDYLLEHIVKPEYHELFRKRWENQDGEDWYRIHVKEAIINDIDGTINENKATAMRYAGKKHEIIEREKKNGNKRPANK